MEFGFSVSRYPIDPIDERTLSDRIVFPLRVLTEKSIKPPSFSSPHLSHPSLLGIPVPRV